MGGDCRSHRRDKSRIQNFNLKSEGIKLLERHRPELKENIYENNLN